ncbi:P-loop containing nucleoside triphosphate hydrolase protein [Daldinia caldariorum]|uniref:P-loop containing nucleoside triphosphate hydrolase protein n=1 Tax=Daldinia caldariorum TaxID=326644 RepID=UPI00200856C8|nr:P-loop containing nucleoside triphosphate hydrolase protein [Daldinia caldariorum]KAI1469405.1 P-loop containing nucleoside triphosphate hydrolase protein [Daldinia caldariorum]
MAPSKERHLGQCRFINHPGGCKQGAFCKFSHNTQGSPSIEKPTTSTEANRSTTKDVSNEGYFYKWKRMAKKGSGNQPLSLGFKLPQYFQMARDLVRCDLDVLQKTVTELATDSGALAVREMIDERIPLCDTDIKRITLWRTCILPFFEILTEPRVSRSVILEVYTGTIYNVIFGPNGFRMEILFNFLVELALKWESPLTQDDDKSKAQFLELECAIFAKMISYNSQALISEKVPPILSRILELVNDVDQSEHNFWTLQARHYLEYIERRIGVIKELSQDDVHKPQILSHTKFELSRDLPGSLSTEGPRHDNDHEDITKIRILPTLSEIMSTRADYRPPQDPSQLHLPGIQGLIDRHFRLLREDMVGQLKDCIAEELCILDHPESKATANSQNHIRTNSYNIAEIMNIKCTRRCELEFHLKIDQPSAAGNLSAEARADWWNLSKRLEIGALVCLLEENTVVFCVVAESTSRPDPSRQRIPKEDKDGNAVKKNLYSNKDFAYVNLNLAEPNEMDLKIMLSATQSHEPARRSLVEFPGILLPSFKPTLSALQQIFQTLDLPFAELLAPSSDGPTELNIPPPLYASKPGFYFNLGCLTYDGNELKFSTKDTVDSEELCSRSSLDEGQATAILNTLKRSLALIQGPPGTGKSYTGEAIIKALLANKEQASIGPILCVCYTNHALDQLLEHLVHRGIKQVIRIGSRSKSSVLTNLNLRNVGKDMERTKSERNASWKSGSALKEVGDEMKAFLTKLKASAIHSKVKEYLKANEIPFYNAIFGIEEDDWTKVANKEDLAYFMDWVNKGSVSKEPVGDIDALKQKDPTLLSQQERFALCTAWGSEVATNIQDEFVSLHDEYQEAKIKHDTVSREVDLRVLQEADIIGVTTTGLARNLDILRKLDSKVLLCEEAGEVLESHILTALLPSVEHAILIGDHLQLRPKISDYELSIANPRGQQYSLDVSLFERLVQPIRPTDLKLPFDMLEIQRRMHPSISSLIKNTIYDTLKDAEKVNDYPEVVGMGKRLFWFDHEKPEARSDPNFPTSTSRTNDFEIEMVSALASHLVRQGAYGRDDIAILTPYLGQLHKLRKRLQGSFELVVEARDLESLEKEGLDISLEVHKEPLGKYIRLATIDNFQGEEAKIVIISLVRSNLERQCGFLKTSNRINVLLSRAQHGMYIVGNSSTYGEVEMWAKVISMLSETQSIGNKLPLQCPRHKDTPIEISGPDDFVRLSPEAGCNLQCLAELDCGHLCRSKCHADLLHKAVKCLEPCPRLKPCGHGCPRLCGDDCEEICSTVLEGKSIFLPCSHILTSPRCWQVQNLHEVRCLTRVEKIVPVCNHNVNVACYEDVTDDSFVCPARCGQPLPCGHTCQDACRFCSTRGGAHPPCASICGRSYSNCKHSCGNQCHPDKKCVPCVMPCDKGCAHTACTHLCSEPCTLCTLTCSSACVHSQCSMPCSAPCNWIPCSKRCEQQLPCGHQCPSVCGETCPDVKYCQICASEEIKTAVVDIYPAAELREYRKVDLAIEPCLFLDCGHVFAISGMDIFMGMAQYPDNTSRDLIDIHDSVGPLAGTTRSCPQCRGSLRSISRYGTVVRQMILAESTKKLVIWSHTKALELERQLIDEQEKLARFERSDRLQESVSRASNGFYVSGNPIDQLLAIDDWVGQDRYKTIVHLYFTIFEHLGRVTALEQSYFKVYDLVRRTNQNEGSMNKPDLDIRTRAQLTARIVLFRCYLLVMSDFVYLRNSTECRTSVNFNLGKAIDECKGLVKLAQEAKYVRQEAEGHILYSKLIAIARRANNTVKSDYTGGDEHSIEKARSHLSKARALILDLPSAAHLRGEIQAIREMVVGGAFFRDVAVEEKRVIWKAMAEEVKENGHWYVCVWGHPFTLLDNELLVEPIKCTECGAYAKKFEKCPGYA